METFEEYAQFFRQECRQLPVETRSELDELIRRQQARPLFLFLENLRERRLLTSPECETAITEFYWSFC